jgi:hypothetical protein
MLSRIFPFLRKKAPIPPLVPHQVNISEFNNLWNKSALAFAWYKRGQGSLQDVIDARQALADYVLAMRAGLSLDCSCL